MITHKLKLLSAAVAAVALIATVAVAHTVHSHATMRAVHASNSKVMGSAPGGVAPSRRYDGFFSCAMASESDCEKYEMMLPM